MIPLQVEHTLRSPFLKRGTTTPEILPQVEEFKYLGVLFTSEGRMDREIDRRIGAASAVMRTLHRSVVVKRAEPKGEAFDLPVDLGSYPHLWS